MKLALIGLPNSGKTTIMRALLGYQPLLWKKKYNYGNLVTLLVPDPRIDKLSALFKPKKITYTHITYLDPTKPLTNYKNSSSDFSTEIKKCEGLIQVIRNFYDGLNKPLPATDYKLLTEELILNDLIIVEHRLEHIAQKRQRGHTIDYEELELCEQAKTFLSEGKALRWQGSIFSQHPKLRGFGLLSSKPLIILINNDEKNYIVDFDKPELVIFMQGAIEADLAELPQNERNEFVNNLKLYDSVLTHFIHVIYQALNLISFFTIDNKEIRMWSVPKSTLAYQAAELIHTDLKKGFIRAEIIRYEDLIKLGTASAVKKAGLIKLVGKEYIITDGDILHIRFNV